MEQSRKPLPEWVRPGSLALVFLGGCVGGVIREALMLLFPHTGAMPMTLLAINLLGALCLGVLLQALIRGTGRAAGRARLLIGTGLLGGFTSYSALALAVTALAVGPHPWLAVLYGLGTVVIGAAATVAGIGAGVLLGRGAGSGRGRSSAAGGDARA